MGRPFKSIELIHFPGERKQNKTKQNNYKPQENPPILCPLITWKSSSHLWNFSTHTRLLLLFPLLTGGALAH